MVCAVANLASGERQAAIPAAEAAVTMRRRLSMLVSRSGRHCTPRKRVLPYWDVVTSSIVRYYRTYLRYVMQWSDRIGRRLKPRDLHVFLAVAEKGNMAKAAEQLAISRPVVS